MKPYLLLFTLICSMGFAIGATADEPLSMKVEMRHGSSGPIRKPAVFAGERLNFCLNLNGLSCNKKNEFEFSVKSDMRDEAGDLQFELPLKEFEYPPQLGPGRISVPLNYIVSSQQPEGALTATFAVTDLVTGKTAKEKIKIDVKKPTSAYPVMVEYLVTNFQGSFPASGRFTTGESISLQYWLVDIAKAKQIKSKLEVFRNDSNDAVMTQDVSVEISAAYRMQKALQGGFSIAATEPFAGKVRLTVTDEAGNSHSVEMPLEVTGPLELGDATFLAENPSKSGEKPKKE
jgi:hypothetical protein